MTRERTQYEQDRDLIPDERDEDYEQMELPLDFEEDEDDDVPSFGDWPYDQELRFDGPAFEVD